MKKPTYGVENRKFCNASRTFLLSASVPTNAIVVHAPEPNSRAVADSFLNSLDAEPAWAAFSTTAGAMAMLASNR